jgi:hypothetical protein
VALAEGFAIGDLGYSRDTTEPEILDPPASLAMAASKAWRLSGLIAGLAAGSCTM